jgi:hypothetical protein
MHAVTRGRCKQIAKRVSLPSRRTECHLLVLQSEIRNQFAGCVVNERAPAEQAETVVETDHNHLACASAQRDKESEKIANNTTRKAGNTYRNGNDNMNRCSTAKTTIYSHSSELQRVTAARYLSRRGQLLSTVQIQLRSARRERAAIDPHHDGQRRGIRSGRIAGDRTPDVQRQTVLRGRAVRGR